MARNVVAACRILEGKGLIEAYVAWSVLGRSLRPVHGFGSFLGARR